MSIFTRRTQFKPFEYPEMEQYKRAIQHSYWLVEEWNFVSDAQDFHVKLNPVERSVVKNALLAISQIEVQVKEFWLKIGERFPKPEIIQIGATFGDSEVRHADAYSHLLQVLGLNEDYSELVADPVISGRIGYLDKYLTNASKKKDEEYSLTLALFSIFVENVSLFIQFAVIKSFNKHLNVLKDIDNVVQATMKEEALHALFGAALIARVKQENPQWFDQAFYDQINKVSLKAYKAECNIIDWMFEEGELSFLTKDTLKEFVKHRINESIEMMGGNALFDVDQTKLTSLEWFNEEIHSEVSTDFFFKRPVTYSKRTQSIQAEDLFDE